jgi:hypothetical protein
MRQRTAAAQDWSFYLALEEYKRKEFFTISLPYPGRLMRPLKRVRFYSGIELQTSGRIYMPLNFEWLGDGGQGAGGGRCGVGLGG